MRAALGLAVALLALPAAAQLTAPARAAPPPAYAFTPVYSGPLGDLQVATAGLEARQGVLVYRVRDGRREYWAGARCAEVQRMEVPWAGLADGPPSATLLEAPDLRWTQAERGTRLELEVQAVCNVARRRGLEVDPPVPEWAGSDVEALANAWLHSAGGVAFDYQVAYFADEQAARLGRMARWGDGSRVLAPLQRADSLVDVPPDLRLPLAQLATPGRRSAVLPVRGRAGQPLWAVLQLVARQTVRRPGGPEEFRRRAAGWVRAGLLPPPATLRAETEHRAQAAFWQARTPEAVRAVPADLTPNIRFGDGQTPLALAVLIDQPAMAQALLERSARPDHCGRLGCPLHLAVTQPDKARRAAWLDLLLGAGAPADSFDPKYAAAGSTPLEAAAFDGDTASVERLLAAGASVDGRPGVRSTPLEAALSGGQRAVAERLIARGARLLPFGDRSERELGRANAWLAARESKEAATLVPWIAVQMLDAARRSPAWRLGVHLEQDGRRLPLSDGAKLDLRAAPFKLVLQRGGAEAPGLVLAASFDPAWAAQARDAQYGDGNGVWKPSRSGALAEPPSEGSYELLAYEARPAGLAAGEGWGGHMHLGFDAATRKDFHEQRAARDEWVREVRAVLTVPDRGEIGSAAPLSALRGKTLTLLLAVALPLDPIEWAPPVHVQVVTLRFR